MRFVRVCAARLVSVLCVSAVAASGCTSMHPVQVAAAAPNATGTPIRPGDDVRITTPGGRRVRVTVLALDAIGVTAHGGARYDVSDLFAIVRRTFNVEDDAPGDRYRRRSAARGRRRGDRQPPTTFEQGANLPSRNRHSSSRLRRRACSRGAPVDMGTRGPAADFGHAQGTGLQSAQSWVRGDMGGRCVHLQVGPAPQW
jgi:hypothetical protein